MTTDGGLRQIFQKQKRFTNIYPLEKVSGVYIIINMVNGNSYIGSSWNCLGRAKQHLTSKGSRLVKAAIKKHGQEHFEGFILERKERTKLPACEAKWMARLKPKYNLTIITKTGGWTVSEHTRQLQSRIRIGIKRPKWIGALISAANTGKKASPEARAKQSLARMGNQHLLGHKHSEESKRKISAKLKGRPSPTKGHINTDEHRAKISRGLKAIYASGKRVAHWKQLHRGSDGRFFG